VDSRIVIDRVWLSEEGRRINYDYRVTGRATRYFSGRAPFYAWYDVDLHGIPESILIIPLIANLAPIAWFAGVELHAAEVDSDFASALRDLLAAFGQHYTGLWSGEPIHAARLVDNRIKAQQSALLFSGGLDSYESLIRHLDERPYLISVLGADIKISDTRRWREFEQFNAEQPLVAEAHRLSIESNLRDFYGPDVDLMVGIGWWGKVQHGMGLLGVCAPLSYKYGFNELLIASSNTNEVDFGWGSHPGLDEKIRWAGLSVLHDGYHLRRVEKVANVVRFAQASGEKVKLRVCYSEHRAGYNCSRCAKCQRTMLAFLLENADPGEFGFELPDNLPGMVLANFPPNGTRMTVGVRYEWQCLQDRARTAFPDARLAALRDGASFLRAFVGLDINSIVDVGQPSVSARDRLRLLATNKFPRAFRAYLAFRNRAGAAK
jgi:hypothetical protein